MKLRTHLLLPLLCSSTLLATTVTASDITPGQTEYSELLGAESNYSLGGDFLSDRKYPHLDTAYKKIQRNELRGASHSLENVLDLDPDDKLVRFQLIQLLWQQQRHNEVENHSNILLQQAEGFAPAYVYRGLSRVERQQIDAGLKDLQIGLKLNYLTPVDRGRALDALLDTALYHKRYQRVIKLPEELLRREHYADTLRLALAHQGAKRYLNAAEHYRRAAELAKGDADKAYAFTAMGDSYNQIGKLGEAETAYRSAVAFAKPPTAILRRLSVVAEMRGKLQDSLAWQKQIAGDQRSANDQQRLDNLQAMVTAGNTPAPIAPAAIVPVESDYDRMQRELQTALNDADHATAMQLLGDFRDQASGNQAALYAQQMAGLYRRDGQHRQELAALREAVMLASGRTRNRLQLELVERLLGMKRNRQAETELKRLLRWHPQANHQQRLINLMQQRGDDHAVIQLLLELSQQKPGTSADTQVEWLRQLAVLSAKHQLWTTAADAYTSAFVHDGYRNADWLRSAVYSYEQAREPQSAITLLEGLFPFQQLPTAERTHFVELLLQQLLAQNEDGRLLALLDASVYQTFSTQLSPVLSQLSYRLQQSNQAEQALALLENAQPFNRFALPWRTELIERYARLQLQTGQTTAALSTLQTAITENGDQPTLLAMLMDVAVLAKDSDTVINTFNRAGPTLRSMPRALINVAMAQQQRQQWRAAAYLFERALERPELTAEQRQLTQTSLGYLHAQLQQYPQAANHWQPVAGHSNSPAALQLRYARVLRLDQQAEAASQVLAQLDASALNIADQTLMLDEQAELAKLRGDHDQAKTLLKQALQLQDSPERRYRLGLVLTELQRPRQAVEQFQSARQQQPGNQDYTAALAYAHVKLEQDQQARPLLVELEQSRTDNWQFTEELAYLDLRLGNNQQSEQRLRNLVSTYPTGADPQPRFGYRRQIEQLQNQFDLNFSSVFRRNQGGGQALLSPVDSSAVQGQGALELSWQPGNIGYYQGKRLQVFGRMFWSYDTDSLNMRARSRQGGVGVRYQPFSQHNLMASAEQLFKIGSESRTDLLLRLSWSLDKGTDYQPATDGWTYRTFFVDAAYSLHDEVQFLSSELRLGWAQRLTDHWTWVPYGLLSANYIGSEFGTRSNADIGLGVAIKHWFNDSFYSAYRSDVEVDLEYRLPFAGATELESGFLLRMLVHF